MTVRRSRLFKSLIRSETRRELLNQSVHSAAGVGHRMRMCSTGLADRVFRDGSKKGSGRSVVHSLALDRGTRSDQ